jgi:cysteine desulfurase
MSQEFIYLDHAAATPVDPRVAEAMQPYLQADFFNPYSPYAPAVAVRHKYEEAKARIAQIIGAQSTEIVITAGATESINLAFASVDGAVVTTAIEHEAVLACARAKEHQIVDVGLSGVVDPEVIKAAINDDTELVSVALANNELGTIQPIRKLSEVVAAERRRRLEKGIDRPIFLHCDASQGASQLDISVARLGVDMLTLNSGKMYGPKQVGLLWHSSEVIVQPMVVGGGQEMGLRSGTENVAGVVGFARALELATKNKKSEVLRLSKLRDGLERKLTEEFPQAEVLGSAKNRLAGHLNIAFAGLDGERLVFALENEDVLVATGSACSANKGKRSHVLSAIGLDPKISDGNIRITLGKLSNEDNIAEAAEKMTKVVAKEFERVGA